MPNAQVRIARKGKEIWNGTPDEFKRRYASGQVDSSDSIWMTGWPTWKSANECVRIKHSLPPTPSPNVESPIRKIRNSVVNFAFFYIKTLLAFVMVILIAAGMGRLREKSLPAKSAESAPERVAEGGQESTPDSLCHIESSNCTVYQYAREREVIVDGNVSVGKIVRMSGHFVSMNTKLNDKIGSFVFEGEERLWNVYFTTKFWNMIKNVEKYDEIEISCKIVKFSSQPACLIQ